MSGFTNDVMNAENVNFSGIDPTEGEITSNGQLMIGSAASPNIRPGFLTSTDGSITVTNGAGTIDISGTASGFQPNAVYQDFDDFTYRLNGSTEGHGKFSWYSEGGLAGTPGTSDHPGIGELIGGGAFNNNMWVNHIDVQAGFIEVGNIAFGGGEINFSFTVQLDALSTGANDYTYCIGMADSTTLSNDLITFVDGVYFQYNHAVNSGNWQIKSTNTSVTTTANTNNAADTEWHTFRISVNAAGTSVSYYIDEVQVANSPIATNIPTAALSPMIAIHRNAGSIPYSYVDLYWITINLSNPRPGPLAGVIPANLRSIENYTQTAISYQVLGTDAIVGVTSTAAPRTMTMPIVGTQAGQIWTIKDESGAASVNNITISGNGFNIDGAATYPISTDYGSVEIYFSGSAFFIR